MLKFSVSTFSSFPEKFIWEKDIWISFVPNTRSVLYKLLSYNYPFLSINRIMPGSFLINFNFSWLKELNDIYWQQLVDNLLCLIKEIIIKEVFPSIRIRLIRTNYKNFTVDADKLAKPILEQFWKNKTLKQFVLSKLKNKYFDNFVNRITHLKENLDLNKFLSDVEKYLLIGKWYVEVDELNNFHDKLVAFYKAEIASKLGIDSYKFETYDISTIKERLLKAYEIESKIVQEYRNWIIYIKLKNGQIKKFKIVKNWQINLKVLDKIRKWYEIVSIDNDNSRLEDKNKINDFVEKIQKIYSNINASLDFIPPYISYSNEIKTINEIYNLIHSWNSIPVEYLLLTYKNAYPKAFLEKFILWKEWKLVYIDIVELWIKNFRVLYELWKKLVAWENVDLINPLKDITKQFINLKKSLEKTFPGSYFSIGGDEIIFFLPENIENNNFYNKLIEVLSHSGFNTRFVCMEGEVNNDTFPKLDKYLNKLKEQPVRDKLNVYYLLVNSSWKNEFGYYTKETL